MNFQTWLLSLILTFSVTLTQAGGGWPQPKGKGYFKLGQSFIIADRFYNPNGNIIDITTISLYTTSIYGEYGFTDRLTGIAYVPFFVRSTLNEVKRRQSGTIEPGDEVNAFGDTNLGVKYALTLNKSIALSATVLFGLPLGETEGGNSKILQTGDGEFNQWLMIEASRGFTGFYITGGIGFNNRTNDFSDEFRYTFEAGFTGINKLAAIFKVNGVKSLNNGDNNEVRGNGVFSNNTEYFSYGPEIAYDIKENFGVTASAFYAFSGKRILAAPQYGFGIFLKL